jgi:hypothetical protein
VTTGLHHCFNSVIKVLQECNKNVTGGGGMVEHETKGKGRGRR